MVMRPQPPAWHSVGSRTQPPSTRQLACMPITTPHTSQQEEVSHRSGSWCLPAALWSGVSSLLPCSQAVRLPPQPVRGWCGTMAL